MVKTKPDDNEHQPGNALEEFFIFPEEELIKPMKNKECCWFHPDDDAVKFIECSFCPLHNDCDKSDSFKNAEVWSFKGHLSCLSYLMQHLTHSTKHAEKDGSQMSDNDAYLVILSAHAEGRLVFQIKDFTKECAKYVRDEHERKQKEKKEAPKKEKEKVVKKKRKHKRGSDSEDDSDSVTVPSKIVRAIQEGVRVAMSNNAMSSSAASADAPGIEICMEPSETSVVQIPLEQLKMIQNSVERAEHAVSTAFIQAATTAKKLDAERIILVKSAELLSSFTKEKPRTMSGSSGKITLALAK